MKIKYKIIGCAIALVSLTNCDSEFLDAQPDNRLDINSLDKAAETLVFAYPKGSYVFLEWMTDNVYVIQGNTTSGIYDDINQWGIISGSATTQDSPQYYWSNAYFAIAQANQVLATIDTVPGDDETYRNAIKGEALLCRAYGHFMLVNIFGEDYKASTASTDLGIPYVLEPEVTLLQNYTRNTVQEVYDFVEKDLLEGIKLVSDNYYSGSGKYHFNKNASLAFASRFYLWKRDYAKSEQYSSQMLGGNELKFVKDMAAAFSGDLDQQTLNFGDPLDDSNLLIMRKETLNYYYSRGYRSSLNLIGDIFEVEAYGRNEASTFPYPTQWRDVFGVDNRASLFGSLSSGLGYTPKYYRGFKVTNLATGIGLPFSIEVPFRGEEVIFNRAESRLMQGNLAGAKTDISIILDNRYDVSHRLDFWLNYYMTSQSLSETDALLELIINQRRIEFFLESLRWFDIKRFDIPVTHITEIDSGLNPLAEIKLEAQDLRKVLQIPDNVEQYGVEPNPRPAGESNIQKIN